MMTSALFEIRLGLQLPRPSGIQSVLKAGAGYGRLNLSMTPAVHS